MDFGKKGDAKKALKLAWKDHKGKGTLTSAELKRAWKKVSGPKKSKPSKPSKRVKNSPKKAMKLAWKNHKGKGPLTSAELKRAWKKTMRFGDTVCPPGEEPNTQWTGGKGQRQCIKRCGFFQMRNPDTNRCKNMVIGNPDGVSSTVELKRPAPELWRGPPLTQQRYDAVRTAFEEELAREQRELEEVGAALRRARQGGPPFWEEEVEGYEINPVTGRYRKICDPPKVRNERGICVVPRAEPVLKPGYEINPDTGRARKMCNQDEYRDPVTKRCRSVVPRAELVLKPGYEINPETGRARKMCNLDEYRDPVTKKCRKMKYEMNYFSSSGRRNRYGGRKCGFGSCMACNMK